MNIKTYTTYVDETSTAWSFRITKRFLNCAKQSKTYTIYTFTTHEFRVLNASPFINFLCFQRTECLNAM